MADLFISNFKITVNGSAISEDLWNNIVSIVVEEEINLPTMFSITMEIPDEELKENWEGLDLATFKPGNPVKISMGADDAVELMSGEITAMDFHFDASPKLEIRGYDKMHRLRFGTKTRSFTEKKDSDLVSTIASESGLSADAEATTTVYPYIFQNNQSNYAFLLERAYRIGYELMVNGDKLIFRKSKETETPESTHVFKYGVNLESFYLSMSVLTRGSAVEVRGWDIKQKKEIVHNADTSSADSKMGGSQSGHEFSSSLKTSPISVLYESVLDATDAENIAKALHNNTLESFITGIGLYIGDVQIRAGKTIKIEGIGDKFTGTYYVYSTIHSVDYDGYRTVFKVRKTGI